MKKTVVHPGFGQITYEENIWTGKKNLYLNGTAMPQIGKNRYTIGFGENAATAVLQGNALTGASLSVHGQQFELYEKPSVLDWLLSFLPFALVMVWGNNVTLCSMIPVIGGAIGGGLGGVALFVTIFNIRGKSLGVKLLRALLATAITFGIGALLGYIFLIALLASTM